MDAPKHPISFVLYNDQIELFDCLSNEQAGILIKHIFNYVNWIDTKIDDTLKLAWIPIKQQLTRNIDKYNNICERNKANIDKRWNNTKYTSGINGIPKIPDDTKNTNNKNNSNSKTDNNTKN